MNLDALRDTPAARQAVVFITGKAVAASCGMASGWADERLGLALSVDTPFRVASNTKTLVSATVFRLWEQGKIALDASIDRLLTPELDAILARNGYDTKAITLFNLLSHSAGLVDHADEAYIGHVLAHPAQRWTREEQLSLIGHVAARPGQPGVEYRYSDTGYILLGNIIERLSAEPLAHVVRREMRFAERGMASTWWERVEPQPPGTEARARQFMEGTDVTELDPSMDLFGGGGLVMSTRDLATFMQQLFEGGIFESTDTLRAMLREGSHRGADGYRCGVAKSVIDGREVFSHLGFWGTVVYYAPDPGICIAACTTERANRQSLIGMIEQALG